jgi:hypothetical protein
VTVLAVDLEAVAQIVIFAAIAIAALIKRIVEARKQGRTRPSSQDEEEIEYEERLPGEEDEEHGPAPRRHEEPATPRPPARPRGERRPAPESASASHRAPGALGGLPAPAAAEARGRLTDFEKTKLHFTGEHPAPTTVAAVLRRPVETSGRALLFGRDLSPRDRVRSAVLWREVLEPPPSLSEPR